jgi:hypothetical protein
MTIPAILCIGRLREVVNLDLVRSVAAEWRPPHIDAKRSSDPDGGDGVMAGGATSYDQTGGMTLSGRRLRTPRAAAIAGIAFALLVGSAYVLIRISIPQDPGESLWLAENAGTVRVALGLIPFAGIAFLWFMGVVRDRIGDYEDRFFSTVFFGSGLLYLAMVFVSASAASSLLAAYAEIPDRIVDSGIYTFGRDLTHRVSNIYSMRMAAVFMLSLATIGIRTRRIPVWLDIATYFLALVLLFVVNVNLWVVLVFPAWVLLISVYFLIVAGRAADSSQGLGAEDAG